MILNFTGQFNTPLHSRIFLGGARDEPCRVARSGQQRINSQCSAKLSWTLSIAVPSCLCATILRHPSRRLPSALFWLLAWLALSAVARQGNEGTRHFGFSGLERIACCLAVVLGCPHCQSCCWPRRWLSSDYTDKWRASSLNGTRIHSLAFLSPNDLMDESLIENKQQIWVCSGCGFVKYSAETRNAFCFCCIIINSRAHPGLFLKSSMIELTGIRGRSQEVVHHRDHGARNVHLIAPFALVIVIVISMGRSSELGV